MTDAPPSTLIVTLWCAATLGHFLLTDLWMRRYGWAGSTRDARFFTATLSGTATLAAALHAVASTTGLGVGTVIALMLPHVIVLLLAWPLLLVVWQILGLPWGF